MAPTVISPASDYIIIDSHSGFANRIRVLSAYLYLKSSVLNVSQIFMVWEVNDECTGHFLDVMKPIKNVTFITNFEADVYETGAKFRFPASFSSFPFILQHFGVVADDRHMAVLFSYLVDRYLIPVEEVWKPAITFVRDNLICDTISIHIRSTDFVDWAKKHNLTGGLNCGSKKDQRRRNGTNIFLMTDSPNSRSNFIDTHRNHTAAVITFGKFLSIPGRNPLRKTSLAHTIIEVLVAAHANSFCGNYPSSSLHHLISAYRRVLRNANTTAFCGGSGPLSGHRCPDSYSLDETPVFPNTICNFRQYRGKYKDNDKEFWGNRKRNKGVEILAFA